MQMKNLDENFSEEERSPVRAGRLPSGEEGMPWRRKKTIGQGECRLNFFQASAAGAPVNRGPLREPDGGVSLRSSSPPPTSHFPKPLGPLGKEKPASSTNE